MNTPPAVDPALIGEAADWLVRLGQGNLCATEQLDFERWRNRSPAHAAAWRRAESVMQTFGAVPQGLRGAALHGLEKNDRRRALSRLAVLLAAAPAAWMLYRELPWQNWSADIRTATGEQKRMTLAMALSWCSILPARSIWCFPPANGACAFWPARSW